MRILHLCDGIPPETLGGAGAIMMGLAREQSLRGHDVHVLAAGTPLSSVRDGSTIHTIGRRTQRFAHYRSVFSEARAREVFEKIEEISPDVIHAHAIAFQVGYRWMRLAALNGFPYVMTFHDAMQVRYGKVTGNERWPALRELRRFRWSYNPWRHRMIKSYLRSAKGLAAVSDALKTYLESYDVGNIRTVRNGIDLGFWKADMPKESARAELGISQSTPSFLIAGRLGGEKGLSLAQNALPRDSALLVAGEAPQMGHDPRFIFFQRLSAEEMKKLYTACDAVLVPSSYLDPLPTVCLEAMAMGKPVLVTSMGGGKETVKHDETGWVLDPQDAATWKRRMEWCATHPLEAAESGMRGRMRAEQLFGIGRMADDMEGVYAEAIA